MPNTIINPSGLPDPTPNGYSHVVTASAGRTIYVAGQFGEDGEGKLVDGFEGQLQQAFANLVVALAGAGAGPANITKLTTFIVDHNEAKLGVLLTELQAMFGEALPAQTLVPVPRLALDGMLFEVDAIALLE